MIWILQFVIFNILSFPIQPSYSFNPSLSNAKSLICYQCSSFSNEIIPLCQIGFFELIKPWEKLNFSFQCPPHNAKFCFVIEKHANGQKETSRGCYGDKDVKGSLMKEGCTAKENQTTCICSKILCNSSQTHEIFYYLLMVLECFLKYIF